MWGEIVQQRYRWDHGHRLWPAARRVRLLTVEGLLDFFDQRIWRTTGPSGGSW